MTTARRDTGVNVTVIGAGMSPEERSQGGEGESLLLPMTHLRPFNIEGAQALTDKLKVLSAAFAGTAG